jgi:MFS superfamily sulfate permease-like transporter
MHTHRTSQGYFALWFLLTGIFALVGGLFTWGRGMVVFPAVCLVGCAGDFSTELVLFYQH